MALGTAGPGTKIIFGVHEEYSLSYFPLKLLCITVVPCAFLCKPYRDVAKKLAWGCRVKFTLVCLSTMGEGGQAWVSKTCSVLDTLPYSVSTILTPHGWDRRKKFEIPMAGERYLGNGVCKYSIL